MYCVVSAAIDLAEKRSPAQKGVSATPPLPQTRGAPAGAVSAGVLVMSLKCQAAEGRGGGIMHN